jgi:hypothetical protein
LEQVFNESPVVSGKLRLASSPEPGNTGLGVGGSGLNKSHSDHDSLGIFWPLKIILHEPDVFRNKELSRTCTVSHQRVGKSKDRRALRINEMWGTEILSQKRVCCELQTWRTERKELGPVRMV